MRRHITLSPFDICDAYRVGGNGRYPSSVPAGARTTARKNMVAVLDLRAVANLWNQEDLGVHRARLRSIRPGNRWFDCLLRP